MSLIYSIAAVENNANAVDNFDRLFGLTLLTWINFYPNMGSN